MLKYFYLETENILLYRLTKRKLATDAVKDVIILQGERGRPFHMKYQQRGEKRKPGERTLQKRARNIVETRDVATKTLDTI